MATWPGFSLHELWLLYCLPNVFWVMQELHEMICLSFQQYSVAEDRLPFCSDTLVAMEVHYTLRSPQELMMEGSLLDKWRLQLQ